MTKPSTALPLTAECDSGSAPRGWGVPILVLFGIAWPAAAQPQEAGSRPATDGLRVFHRSETAEDLRRAAGLPAKGELKAALEAYLAIMESDADALIPHPESVGRYVSAAEVVQNAIARLPPEGLRLYRGARDSEAARLLQEGRRTHDVRPLLVVARTMRHASAAAEAVDLAAGLYFDAADFRRAAALWSRWLDDYPSQSEGRRVRVMTRLALSWHYCGDWSAAAAVAARLSKESPDVRLLVGGRRVRAADFLANCPAKPAPTDLPGNDGAVRPGESPGWTVPRIEDSCGDGVARGHETAWVTPWGLEFQCPSPLPAECEGDVCDTKRKQERPSQPVSAELPRARPVPSVCDGRVFVRYADRIAAVSLASGRLLWSVNDACSATRLECGRLTVTACQGRLWHLSGARGEGERLGVRPEDVNFLVCRDAESGAELWRIGGGRRGAVGASALGDDQALPASVRFLTAPAWSEGRLLVAFDYEGNCGAACLNASDGRPIWVRRLHVLSDPGQRGWGRRRRMGSPPLIRAGIVYVLTNDGVLAALDEATGRPEWVTLYPRLRPADNGRKEQRGDDPGSMMPMFPPSPLADVGGRLFMLPTDADRVFCVDMADGRIAWSAPRLQPVAGGRAAVLWRLAGVGRETVVLAGSGAAALSAADGKLRWAVSLPPAGRPAVTGGEMFLAPAGMGLTRVRLSDGTVGPLGRGRQTDAPLSADDGLLAVRGWLLAASESGAAAFRPVEGER